MSQTDGTPPAPPPAGGPPAWQPPGREALEADTPDPEPVGKSRLRNALEWVVIIAGALVVAFLVKTFLIQAFYIPSDSMEPTLQRNDRILVNKLSYDLHGVERGDLVVFESPQPGVEGRDLIKRAVAIAGDTVESREGKLHVNGEEVDEPYLAPGVATEGFERTTIPPDHIWVMGDNRPNSRDSRFFGALPEENIIGKAFIRIYPITDITLF